jgi:hypothetical protein
MAEPLSSSGSCEWVVEAVEPLVDLRPAILQSQPRELPALFHTAGISPSFQPHHL